MEDIIGMIKVGKRRILACITFCVMFALIAGAGSEAALFGLFKSKKQESAATVKYTLVIFPFDRDTDSAAAVPDTYGETIAGYLRNSLSTSKGYSVLLYDARLTPIKRAMFDNFIREQDTKAPFSTDKPKVEKLAQALSTDYYIIGSVEGYDYNREKKMVEITLKADLVLAEGGKVTQEFLVAATAGDGKDTDDEDSLRSLATGKAVQALTEKILATSPADVKAKTAEKPAKKK